ncbi:hypothetical protein BDR22DRAFT_868413 [Usnea florida]
MLYWLFLFSSLLICRPCYLLQSRSTRTLETRSRPPHQLFNFRRILYTGYMSPNWGLRSAVYRYQSVPAVALFSNQSGARTLFLPPVQRAVTLIKAANLHTS